MILIKKFIKNCLSFFKWQKYALRNFANKRPPINTGPKNNLLKLHIGPGDIDLKGWINIDVRNLEHVHLSTDNIDLHEFSDNSIGEIYICHMLEHLSFIEASNTIDILYKKLSYEGILRISVPDFKIISDTYSSTGDLDSIKFPLMGGQDYPSNFHKSIYDQKTLFNLLKAKGFREIANWETEEVFGQSIGDWSDGYIKNGNKKIKISLNVFGIK